MNQNTVYSGRVTNWPLIGVATLLAVVLVLAGGGFGDARPGALVILAVVALMLVAVVLTTSSVRTTTGRNGVLVRFGALGWPRFSYPLSTIRAVEALDLSLWTTGGWGIHWSPWRGTRLTLRSGPALRLQLASGRKVTVSVKDPAAALAALHAAAPSLPVH